MLRNSIINKGRVDAMNVCAKVTQQWANIVDDTLTVEAEDEITLKPNQTMRPDQETFVQF